MIRATILLTSFAPWKANHGSNAADDLLFAILGQGKEPSSLQFLRHLPVNLPVAQELAIAKLKQYRPQFLLCCGMAENRSHLNLEVQATVGDRTRQTPIKLEPLIEQFQISQISHDAGRFVCNAFYYRMLEFTQEKLPETACLFVHVPRLTAQNRTAIVSDFTQLLDRLRQAHCPGQYASPWSTSLS
jgi:pyroglutamyl-peptidase